MVENLNSFKRGYNKVPRGIARKVRREIMSVMEINSNSGWFYILNGNSALKQIEKDAIEKVFQDHSITDIWGDQ